MVRVVTGRLEGCVAGRWMSLRLRDEAEALVGTGGSALRLRSPAKEGEIMKAAVDSRGKLLWLQTEGDWLAAQDAEPLDIPDAEASDLQSRLDRLQREAFKFGAVIWPSDWRCAGRRLAGGFASPVSFSFTIPALDGMDPVVIPLRHNFTPGSVPSVSSFKRLFKRLKRRVKDLSAAAVPPSLALPHSPDVFGLGTKTTMGQRNALLALCRMVEKATAGLRERSEALSQAVDYLQESSELVRLGLNAWGSEMESKKLPASISSLLHSLICDAIWLSQAPLEMRRLRPSALVQRALDDSRHVAAPVQAPEEPMDTAPAARDEPDDDAAASGPSRRRSHAPPQPSASTHSPAASPSPSRVPSESSQGLASPPPEPASTLTPPEEGSPPASPPHSPAEEPGPEAVESQRTSPRDLTLVMSDDEGESEDATEASSAPPRPSPTASASISAAAKATVATQASPQAPWLALSIVEKEEVVWRLGRASLTAGSLMRLASCGRWLDDSVIAAVLLLIQRRSEEAGRRRVHTFDPLFLPKLMREGYASVRRWTRDADVLAKELLLVPVHRGDHWCLVVVDLAAREVHYFDSKGGADNGVMETLLRYVRQEAWDKRAELKDTSAFARFIRSDVPQQSNDFDCGVFLLSFADLFSSGAPLTSFSQADVPSLRQRYTEALLQHQLH